MDCILVRHGIAVELDEWEGAEENRPLTGEGERGKGKGRTRQAAEGLAALGCKPTHLLSCGKALHNFSLKKVGGCACRIRGRYEPGRGAAVLVASADAAAGLREAISCQETWGFLRGGRLRADRRIVWTVSIIVTAP